MIWFHFFCFTLVQAQNNGCTPVLPVSFVNHILPEVERYISCGSEVVLVTILFAALTTLHS